MLDDAPGCSPGGRFVGHWRGVSEMGARLEEALRMAADSDYGDDDAKSAHEIFDEFFGQAAPMETVLTLSPLLAGEVEEASGDGFHSKATVKAQARRLLCICLVEQEGVREMATAFGLRSDLQLRDGGSGNLGKASWLEEIFQASRLIVSISDRAGVDAPSALRSPFFYESVSRQLLAAGERRCERESLSSELAGDGTFVFIGEVLSRLCRRGQADVVALVFVPVLMQHVKRAMGESHLGVRDASVQMLWTGVMVSVKDSHAMEKLVEAILREMAAKVDTDVMACSMLRMLFGSLLSNHDLTRMVVLDKCLFVKVLPIRCLRWILEVAVVPKPALQMDTEVVRRMAQVWSSSNFVRSASLPKQAYLTAAVGMCVRRMSKDDMDKCGGLMRSILQGVTNRLESPLTLVREMAKRLALALSLAINPAKPLLLDDEDHLGDLDDWEYLSLKAVGSREQQSNEGVLTSAQKDMDNSNLPSNAAPTETEHGEKRRQRRERHERLAMEEDNPDAVINLGEEDSSWFAESEGSGADSSSDSEGSLQPYDMSDDESELENRKLPSQLSSCAANLRKPDDPDAVERALQVVEELIRAMPVELENAAGELAQALVHVRTGANSVEGEEEKVEKRRHGALVALLACAPLSSIVIVTQEVFSPHLDISQRLLLLDAIADAAQELAGRPTGRSSGDQGFVTHRNPVGAGPWSEVPAMMPGNALVGWAQRYERELPLRKGDRRVGTSRKLAPRSMQLREERQSRTGRNTFAPLASAFMLPIMRDYDKRAHGVDFLDSGFIVLGKILYTLGVCVECVTAQPEALALGANLLELLRSRAVANHPEAYVRRAALYAASRVIVALHPSQVVAAITGADSSIASGLEWVREWALGVANNDPDSDCASVGMACVQLHSEMALQAMRAMQSAASNNSIRIQTSGERSIIMPF